MCLNLGCLFNWDHDTPNDDMTPSEVETHSLGTTSLRDHIGTFIKREGGLPDLSPPSPPRLCITAAIALAGEHGTLAPVVKEG